MSSGTPNREGAWAQLGTVGASCAAGPAVCGFVFPKPGHCGDRSGDVGDQLRSRMATIGISKHATAARWLDKLVVVAWSAGMRAGSHLPLTNIVSLQGSKPAIAYSSWPRKNVKPLTRSLPLSTAWTLTSSSPSAPRIAYASSSLPR